MVLQAVSAIGGTIPNSIKFIAAKAIAQSIDTVFIIPLATGLAAFFVAACTEWRKIKKPEELKREEELEREKEAAEKAERTEKTGDVGTAK
jgi:TRAP-type C4-dicarboxylate transport system permease large subunit